MKKYISIVITDFIIATMTSCKKTNNSPAAAKSDSNKLYDSIL